MTTSTKLTVGEITFELSAGWTHRGNESRQVLQSPTAELILTVLTGWPEGNTKMRANATKTAIREATELMKNEELGEPEVQTSAEMWWSISKAKDGTFFGQIVATGRLSLLYLTYESLGDHPAAEGRFRKIVDAASAQTPVAL